MLEPRPIAAARLGSNPATWAFAALLFALTCRYVVGSDSPRCSLSPEELRVHLSADRAAWLATWMPDSGLGRPLPQIGGPAFWPAHLLSRVVAEPSTFAAGLAWLGFVAAWLTGARWFVGGGVRRWGAVVVAGIFAAIPMWVYLADGASFIEVGAVGPWALASGWLGLMALRSWLPDSSDRGGGRVWSLVVLALAMHSLALVAPLAAVRDIGVLWLLAAIYFAACGGRWRRLRAVALATLAAAITVAPIYLDQWNLRGLPAGVDAPVTGLPLLVSAEAATETSDGHWSLNLAHPGFGAGAVEVDRIRSDQQRWRLPKKRGERLFVLRSRFDPRWRTFFKARETAIICVNETYLGVLLTKRAYEANVSFVPFSPLVLLAQLGFAALGLVWLVLWIQEKRGRPRPA